MITTVVGKTFLEAYNAKYEVNKSPKEFFEEVYFELFYNHAKYMQWVTNSPFVQMKTGQKPELLTHTERIEKLENLFEKVENSEPDASFALGFPASELKEYASTSGLVSDLVIPTTPDDIYLSWIGSGLGIGVAGGFSILYNDAKITLQTFEGWKIYRKYLEDDGLDKLRGNQINTWNGQWLKYSLDKDEYREDFDFTELTNQKIFAVSESLAEVNTVNWSELFFSLSQLYPQGELTGYVYGFGQTNKTIGFIPFYLKSGTRIIDIYRQLFGELNTDKKRFEALFGMHIKRACELGSIGLQALRPEGLVKYMKEDKTISLKKEEDTFNYYAYKTWLIAMISKNKDEITDYTLELAETFLEYRNRGSKNDRKTLLEKLFSTKTKKAFLTNLTEMIEGFEKEEDRLKLRNFRNETHLMTNEEFEYFHILLKFDYTFVEKNNKN
ncbi:hypothetical protein [Emticicia sp. 21SJ11W-3]|uniref:hypothetical protein n=1 Tax=Emticicia sp. 21SJ11W-3 TaxID=2916755 RepID=UPI00209E55F1|nr:hypothetical protein [Emticicia sp. 21SJ11W-3]UTA67681.1 hypothetical protein MB380_19090 [Emticicia sp. 21SJ11W-3]